MNCDELLQISSLQAISGASFLTLSGSLHLVRMQAALDELQNSMEVAEDYLKRDEKRARYLRVHINALVEDIDLVSSFVTSSAKLQQESFQLRVAARAIKHRLERLLSESVSQSSDQQTPAIVATQKTEPKEGESLAPEIPSFNGDSTKFPVYRTILEENVISNPNMTATSKWVHLRKSLFGHPAELISEMPHTPEALDVAVKLLDDVYGGKDRISAELYAKFHDLPVASLTADSIRMTHAKLEGILLSLTHLQHSVNENEFIKLEYIRKFPSCVIYEVFRTESTQLQTIRDGIAQLLLARESLPR